MLNRALDPVSGRAIRVALDVGLFQALDAKRARHLAELARECGCAERGLAPLLHLLTSVGLLSEFEDGYRLVPGTQRYLDRDYAKAWVQLPEASEYHHLEMAVRTGHPVRPPVESETDAGDFFAAVAPALFDLHWPAADRLADIVSSGTVRVLDLGAGSAVWSLAVVKKHPQVRVVAVDRARVLTEVTRQFLDRHRVLDRYELREGDYHEVELEEGAYDLIILGHLLHADGWVGTRRLLARARRALAPSGAVAIAEILASEPRSLDYAANVFDLSMLLLTDAGLVFAASELIELVEQAGLREWDWIEVPGDYPVLLATAQK